MQNQPTLLELLNATLIRYAPNGLLPGGAIFKFNTSFTEAIKEAVPGIDAVVSHRYNSEDNSFSIIVYMDNSTAEFSVPIAN